MKEESKKCWEKQMSGEEKNCGVKIVVGLGERQQLNGHVKDLDLVMER